VRRIVFSALVSSFLFGTPGVAIAASEAVAPEIRRVLDSMGTALSAAPRFATTARTNRRLEAEGFVQEATCDFQLGVERPNRLSLRHGRGVYCETTVSDGQKLFVYEPSHGHYFTRPAPADLDAVLEESGAQQGPGLGMLAGLLSRDPVAWLLDGVTEAKEAAPETQDGVSLRRFDFVQENLDWSLWLEAHPPHWPRRVEERSSAGPQYPKSTTMRTTLDLGRWETGPIAAEVFRFVPPPGVAEASHGEEGGAAIGEPAPDLRFMALADTSEVSLASLRGKVVVLELWASWCEPCVRALPELHQTAQALAGTDAGREIVFLAVNQGEDAATARAFLETHKTLGEPLRFVLDEASNAGEQLGADGIPYAVVVDKQGIVRAAHAGYSPAIVRQLRSDIDKALAGDGR
jgi:thiol-disulfide isomerase/thioredoxin